VDYNPYINILILDRNQDLDDTFCDRDEAEWCMLQLHLA
jgi:hypothetical protein